MPLNFFQRSSSSKHKDNTADKHKGSILTESYLPSSGSTKNGSSEPSSRRFLHSSIRVGSRNTPLSRFTTSSPSNDSGTVSNRDTSKSTPLTSLFGRSSSRYIDNKSSVLEIENSRSGYQGSNASGMSRISLATGSSLLSANKNDMSLVDKFVVGGRDNSGNSRRSSNLSSLSSSSKSRAGIMARNENSTTFSDLSSGHNTSSSIYSTFSPYKTTHTRTHLDNNLDSSLPFSEEHQSGHGVSSTTPVPSRRRDSLLSTKRQRPLTCNLNSNTQNLSQDFDNGDHNRGSNNLANERFLQPITEYSNGSLPRKFLDTKNVMSSSVTTGYSQPSSPRCAADAENRRLSDYNNTRTPLFGSSRHGMTSESSDTASNRRATIFEWLDNYQDVPDRSVEKGSDIRRPSNQTSEYEDETYAISRATSPHITVDCGGERKSFISRTTEPIVSCKRRQSVLDKHVTIGLQTDFLLPLDTVFPDFDLYSHVKESMCSSPSYHTPVISSLPGKGGPDDGVAIDLSSLPSVEELKLDLKILENSKSSLTCAPVVNVMNDSMVSSIGMAAAGVSVSDDSEYEYITETEDDDFKSSFQGHVDSEPVDNTSGHVMQIDDFCKSMAALGSPSPSDAEDTNIIDVDSNGNEHPNEMHLEENSAMKKLLPRQSSYKSMVSGTMDIDVLLSRDEALNQSVLDYGVSPSSPPVLDLDSYYNKFATTSPTQVNSKTDQAADGHVDMKLDSVKVFQEIEKCVQMNVNQSLEMEEMMVMEGSGNIVVDDIELENDEHKSEFIQKVNLENDFVEHEEFDEVNVDEYHRWLQDSVALHNIVDNRQQKMNDHDIDLANCLPKSEMSNQCFEVSTSTPESRSRELAKSLVDQIKSLSGVELKKVLFSLKSHFQSERTLVYHFVELDGIKCLVEIGVEKRDLTNLILRAIGQLMLYVDGMNGVTDKNSHCVKYMYSLIDLSNVLVCKTVMKLLLVFVEYQDANSSLLVQSVTDHDTSCDQTPWYNLTRVILKVCLVASDRVSTTTDDEIELATLALSLINKCLFDISEQDRFFDQVDLLDLHRLPDALVNYLKASFVDDPSTCIHVNATASFQEQVQTFIVALKQEDGEAVGESDASLLNEDSAYLRSCLRVKSKRHAKLSGTTYLRHSLPFLRREMFIDESEKSTPYESTYHIIDLKYVLRIKGIHPSPSGSNLVLDNESAGGNNSDDPLVKCVSEKYLERLRMGEDPNVDEESSDIDEQATIPPDSPYFNIEHEGEKVWLEVISDLTEDEDNISLKICELDFSDLKENDPTGTIIVAPGDEKNKTTVAVSNGGPIPLPPPLPPPMPPSTDQLTDAKKKIPKTKKTLKLFWREVLQQNVSTSGPNLWTTNTNELRCPEVDYNEIEHLFEVRSKRDSLTGKDIKLSICANREIIVLEHKRSNAINIGMTRLPPPRVLKSAVLKMDSSVINRDGIEKLLTMLPTDSEIDRIRDAQLTQPDIPLGSAEFFLMTLSSIPCLEARLRLWSFKMEFEICEKEVCEPLMDLKVGISTLKRNDTFIRIMHLILTIGNFLNNSSSFGFNFDFLSKVSEIKDSIYKHSLLFHITYILVSKDNEVSAGTSDPCPTVSSSDLYSEIGPIIRCSRTDFEDLEVTLKKLEKDCKLAFGYLLCGDEERLTEHGVREVVGHIEEDTKQRMNEFLVNAARRIITMKFVFSRSMKLYKDFLSWLGIASFRHADYKVHFTCKIIAEFALEFRTTRERVIDIMRQKEAKRKLKKQQKILLAASASTSPLTGSAGREGSNSVQSRQVKRHHNNLKDGENSLLESILDDRISLENERRDGKRRRKKHTGHNPTRSHRHHKESKTLKSSEDRKRPIRPAHSDAEDKVLMDMLMSRVTDSNQGQSSMSDVLDKNDMLGSIDRFCTETPQNGNDTSTSFIEGGDRMKSKHRRSKTSGVRSSKRHSTKIDEPSKSSKLSDDTVLTEKTSANSHHRFIEDLTDQNEFKLSEIER